WDLAAADVRAARGSGTFPASAAQHFASVAYLAAAGDLAEAKAASAEALRRCPEAKNAGEMYHLALAGLLLPDRPRAPKPLRRHALRAVPLRPRADPLSRRERRESCKAGRGLPASPVHLEFRTRRPVAPSGDGPHQGPWRRARVEGPDRGVADDRRDERVRLL